ncbi:hypothetical protein HGM15179_019192, partial [Zosterops borbonicus]
LEPCRWSSDSEEKHPRHPVDREAGPVWVLSRFTRACPPARIPSDSENDPNDNDLPGTPSDDPETDQN